MKDEITTLVRENPASYSKKIKSNSMIWGWLDRRTNYLSQNATVSERVYHVINDLYESPKCICSKNRKYTNNINLGYSGHCSYKCSHVLHHRKAEEEYRKSLELRRMVLIGEYFGVTVPTEHKCLVCEHVWAKRPCTTKQGCPKCAVARLTKSNEEYISQLPSNITSLESYVNAKSKISHLDSRCGHTWKSRPNDILTGFGCPFCNIGGSPNGGLGTPTEFQGVVYASKLEAECAGVVFSIFQNNDVELQKRYIDGRRYTCDFYIKSQDLWIEVSNLDKLPDYLTKINFKKSLVENFIFARSPKELEEELNVRYKRFTHLHKGEEC